MIFIFPQNYNTGSKLFGFIDYSTAILNIVWTIIVFLIVNIFISSVIYKISICIMLSMPIFILSIVGFNHENIIYVFKYIFKFYNKQKIYLYNKSYE